MSKKYTAAVSVPPDDAVGEASYINIPTVNLSQNIRLICVSYYHPSLISCCFFGFYYVVFMSFNAKTAILVIIMNL